ncbi:hypothetical protein F5883DRAFT_554587 [Diaporthe sp. PMI_573]|nr:hypothetical protein F5883DRAFT_554587 [Diaporthaceae sp. PMI_573]
MLREAGTSVDGVFEKLEGGSTISLPGDCGMRIDTEGHRNSDVSCECQNCWSPSTATTDLPSNSSQGHSPFSFDSSGDLNNDSPQSSTISQPASIPDLQNQSAAMQANPWASPNTTCFGGMLDNMMPINLNMDIRPTIIDPLLWPPIQGSDSLGQPIMNSWTGLMGDATCEGSRQIPFSCLA